MRAGGADVDVTRGWGRCACLTETTRSTAVPTIPTTTTPPFQSLYPCAQLACVHRRFSRASARACVCVRARACVPARASCMLLARARSAEFHRVRETTRVDVTLHCIATRKMATMNPMRRCRLFPQFRLRTRQCYRVEYKWGSILHPD